MKKLFFAIALFFTPIFLSAQSFWAEYQHNFKYYKQDSSGFVTNTLSVFYSGKENKNGFSMTAFGLVTKDWGELLVLPTWTKKTKAGLFALSIGGGLETATKMPRLGASVFYLKDRFEGLFFWEQGTDRLSNNWHLGYFMYTPVQHADDTYCSFGLHSQRGALHGFRSEIGIRNDFSASIVLGKPDFKQRGYGALILVRKFL